jgi:hypothetical protein
MEIVKFNLNNLQNFLETYDLFGLDGIRKEGYVDDVEIELGLEEALFSRIYLYYRRSLHHKGLRMIKEGSKRWPIIVEITKKAIEFSDKFNLEHRQGFLEYLQEASTIDRLELNKLNWETTHHKIMEHYGLMDSINNSPHFQDSVIIQRAFVEEVVQRYGTHIEVTLKDQVKFITAAQWAKERKMTPKMYVEFLAEKWAWTGNFEPHHLASEKAKEYLREYDQAVPVKKKIKKVKISKGWNKW